MDTQALKQSIKLVFPLLSDLLIPAQTLGNNPELYQSCITYAVGGQHVSNLLMDAVQDCEINLRSQLSSNNRTLSLTEKILRSSDPKLPKQTARDGPLAFQ